MRKWQITSRAGVDMGVYEGMSKEAALSALHTEAGYHTWVDSLGQLCFQSQQDRELCGDIFDWHFDEVK